MIHFQVAATFWKIILYRQQLAKKAYIWLWKKSSRKTSEEASGEHFKYSAEIIKNNKKETFRHLHLQQNISPRSGPQHR